MLVTKFIADRADLVSSEGGGRGAVSYPDPNVRNDDHRLQYDITCTEGLGMTYELIVVAMSN